MVSLPISEHLGTVAVQIAGRIGADKRAGDGSEIHSRRQLVSVRAC